MCMYPKEDHLRKCLTKSLLLVWCPGMTLTVLFIRDIVVSYLACRVTSFLPLK
jgi:hypothetical protein